MSVLVCKDVSYLYGSGTPFETAALDDINLEIEKSQIIGVIGHTGSGKSTLIQHFNGLLRPSNGSVFVDGKDIWSKENKKNIRSVRFKIGLCFQYPEYQIFEENIFKEVAYGPKQMGLDNAEVEKRVKTALTFLGLEGIDLNASPFDLSGGQKRRVAIASIIAMQPEVLVLDEPCAGLDPIGRENILSLIKNYQKGSGNTVIFVSHSMEDVASLCDKVLVMNKGKAAYFGTVRQVYSHVDELYEMGLSVPEITYIFSELKKHGVDCRTDIYNIKDGVSELKRLFGAEDK